MVRGPVGVFGSTTSKPHLEIVPDSPFVVLYGLPSEAAQVELTGKVVLTNHESMAVRGIKVNLSGIRKVSWMTNTVTPQPIVSKRHFMKEEVNLFPVDGIKNKAHKISPGVHEWTFKFTIPGDTDESLEGLVGNYIVYNLNAVVDRGYISKQICASKHIRIVRTLGQDLMESVPMEQINEDIWGSKLAYKITVPQKNYIIGTSITADFVLVPLRKGVEITTIKMEVIEHMVLTSEYTGRTITHAKDHVVATIESSMPENSAHVVPEGMEEADQLFDESHRFSMTLDLPRSLKQCRQSVDTDHMKVVHKLRLYVNLHNPEGHTSQLLVKNHLHLFISPNLPPNEDQSVLIDHNIISHNALRDEANQTAPPTYGLHQLDELYSGIDTSGFMTPGGANSGLNTPFYSQSRSGSNEDIPSTLDAVAQDDGPGASASALHTRLSNLSVAQNRSTRFVAPPSADRSRSYHSSGNSTPFTEEPGSSSQPSSYRSRGYFDGNNANTAEVYGSPEYNMEALTKIPSYNTALRTPIATPGSETLPMLPSYEIATSRPASPTHSPHGGVNRTTPSPSRSLDTLTEETVRNTELNSRRTSPSRREVLAGSGEQRSSSPLNPPPPDTSPPPNPLSSHQPQPQRIHPHTSQPQQQHQQNQRPQTPTSPASSPSNSPRSHSSTSSSASPPSPSSTSVHKFSPKFRRDILGRRRPRAPHSHSAGFLHHQRHAHYSSSPFHGSFASPQGAGAGVDVEWILPRESLTTAGAGAGVRVVEAELPKVEVVEGETVRRAEVGD